MKKKSKNQICHNKKKNPTENNFRWIEVIPLEVVCQTWLRLSWISRLLRLLLMPQPPQLLQANYRQRCSR